MEQVQQNTHKMLSKYIRKEVRLMSMPTIPKQPHRPNHIEVIIDLLESIALEEISLSHLINSEAEKVQAFVGECLDFPTNPTNEELLRFSSETNQFMEILLMKEWVLLRKVQKVKELIPSKKQQCTKTNCDCD
jgi:hypothetical protein